MKCIIVDDDLFSTKLISDFIERTPSLVLAGSFDNAIDAIGYLSQTGDLIHVIFCDIEMPDMTGLEFIKSIDCTNTKVIIYSSQEKYALMSYEYDVCDYLLKPVKYARFLKAINKAKTELVLQMSADVNPQVEFLNYEPSLADSERGGDGNFRFIRESSGAQTKIMYSDIVFVEAQENYVRLVTTSKSYIIHATMSSFVDSLPEEYVVRVHRSYAVGIKHIKNIVDGSVVLEGSDMAVPVGRSYKAKMKEFFDELCSKYQ